MRKISLVIILLAGVLATICFWAVLNAKADGNAQVPSTQILNDEGYGNEDAEYYNSEDEPINDEGASGPQKNPSTDVQK